MSKSNLFKLKFKNTNGHGPNPNSQKPDGTPFGNNEQGPGAPNQHQWDSIGDSKIIMFFKDKNKKYLQFEGQYYEASGNDFEVGFDIDDSQPYDHTKDSITINGQTPTPVLLPQNNHFRDIEYAVVTTIIGSVWKLFYFNGRAYWIRIG